MRNATQYRSFSITVLESEIAIYESQLERLSRVGELVSARLDSERYSEAREQELLATAYRLEDLAAATLKQLRVVDNDLMALYSKEETEMAVDSYRW